MNTFNYKSLLQEKLQSIKEDIPIYDTKKVKNEQPCFFVSKVSFSVNGKEYSFEKNNELSLSKKGAEKYIASIALEELENILKTKNNVIENNVNNKEKKLISKIKKKVTIFIDYENCNIDKEVDNLKNLTENNKNIEVIKICSEYSPLVEKADMTVPSSRKDATDVAICCMVATKVVENNERKIFIITRDSFASCLVDIYKEETCCHVPTVQKCIEKLIDLS